MLELAFLSKPAHTLERIAAQQISRFLRNSSSQSAPRQDTQDKPPKHISGKYEIKLNDQLLEGTFLAKRRVIENVH
jgi:hypothetical protein